MNAFVAEFLGTLILILLGNGVVCNVVLAKTKGHEGGWLLINAGWAVAVFVGAACANAASGAHLNPAITIAQMALGKMSLANTVGYIAAQFLGAIAGAMLTYVFYRPHFEATDSADDKLGCFCNAPAIPGTGQAILCEIVGTFVLVFAILQFEAPKLESSATEVSPVLGLGSIGLLPVALLVFGIGMSLGGTTGYAINPARDLGPRIAHFLLPIPGKRDSDWGYSWIPVIGPILGGLIAAGLHVACRS
jgi:glycerol uptake facilitator protein